MSARFILITFLFSSLIFFAGPAGIAQNAPVTTAGTIGNATPGNISVPVTVTGFSDIGAISLTIEYNYSVIHFTGSTPNPQLPGFIAGDLDLGTGFHRITMGWYGSPKTLADGSAIITLHFTYIAGISALTWYDNGPSCEYADGDINVLNDIPIETYYINGSVCGPVGDPGPITGDTIVCAGQTGIIYSVIPIPNATGYTWDLQDGAVIVNGENTNAITVDFNNSAVSGEITVYGTNVCGPGPLSELNVVVNSRPVANAGNDTTINYGTSTTLHAASGEYEVYSYHWSPEELLVDPDEQNPQTVILTQTTLFSVLVTNQATFCQNSDHVIVTITGGPLSANPVALPSELCLGSSSQLFSNAGGGSGNYSYLWTVTPPENPPWSSTEANPEVTPDSSKTYHLVVNDGFTTVTDSVEIEVSPLPTATISGGDTLCGENVFTTLQVDLTGSPPWDFTYSYENTSVFVTNQQESPCYIIAADPGDYVITAINDAFCNGTSYGTAIVRKYPVPDTPEITINGYELISSACCGNQWYKNGNIIPGETGQTYHVTESGQYHTIVTLNGCSSDTSEPVDMVVGIAENGPCLFIFYPNPAKNSVFVQSCQPLSGSFKLSLCTASGMLIKEYEFSQDNKLMIDISSLSQGLYFLVFSCKNNHTAKKLIVSP